jgi:hypothetical protein
MSIPIRTPMEWLAALAKSMIYGSGTTAKNLADGINADGSLNTKARREEALSNVWSGTIAANGATSVEDWIPGGNMSEGMLYIDLVTPAGGGGTFTISILPSPDVVGNEYTIISALGAAVNTCAIAQAQSLTGRYAFPLPAGYYNRFRVRLTCSGGGTLAAGSAIRLATRQV